MANNDNDFEDYHYNPSIAAACIFTALFFLITLLHFYQMIRTRTWVLIPFVIGGFLETAGYIGVRTPPIPRRKSPRANPSKEDHLSQRNA